MTTASPSGEVKHLAMKVHDVGFLLDRLGQDCHPLQFLRELTQNSIEAIQRTKRPGEVVWDVDWLTYELADTPLFKLCIIDTGDGMTGPDMMRFINHLSSSGGKQAMDANYGIGAKIAAATRNPHGVIYQSWRSADGWMIDLNRDGRTNEYGLRQFRLEDGGFEHFLPLEESVMPDAIRKAGSGTKVILMGRSHDEDTLRPPPGTPSPSRWISKYLNSRYFKFPESIVVKAREGWEFPRTDTDNNVLRVLTGQKKYLDTHSEQRGVQKITGAKVYWWILKDEPARGNNSGFIESSGHVAALYKDELYDRVASRSGSMRLQQFGITFGATFVVIYVEPIADAGRVLATNTARTTLLINSESLPWEEWAAAFRENLPAPLADFVAEKAAKAAGTDHSKSIKERLKEVMGLYKVSRYRPSPQGQWAVDPEAIAKMSNEPDAAGRNSGDGGGAGEDRLVGTGVRGRKQTERGSIYHLFEKKGGLEADKVRADPFPKTDWISVSNGTREKGDLEDRAARYIKESNHLLINADFRVFADMISHFAEQVGGTLETHESVREIVRAWFEQALVETVIGIQALRNSREWSSEDIDGALSETSLTAAVMQRYHINFAVRRELGSKFGKLGQGANKG
jgi:hypothetical protein